MAGRPKKEYDKQMARVVEALSGYGVPQNQIADVIGMHRLTMTKLYRAELDKGKAKADSKILETLYKKAVEQQDTACLIFMCKTRLRMSERVEVSGPDGGPVAHNHEVKVSFVGEDDE